MVNPNVDGRSWAGNAAEEPRCCGGLHPAARSHDRHRIQLPPRKWKSMMGCYQSRDKALTSLSLVKQIESNIGWFGPERQ